MFTLIFIIKCLLTLVSTNPLQGLQSYPLAAYQQSYVNQDQPVTTQNFDAYPQLLRQNTWPSYQNTPITYQDISKGYYENFQVNSVPNVLGNTNTRVYDQNGVDITQYMIYPREINSNLMSNYVTLPKEYLNQYFDSKGNSYIPTQFTVPSQSNQNVGTNNKLRNTNYNDPTQHFERNNKNNTKKRKSNHSKRNRDVEENQNKPVKRKNSTKNNKRKNSSSDKNIDANDERKGEVCNNKISQKKDIFSINNASDSNKVKKKSKEHNILEKKPKINLRSKPREPDIIDENNDHIKYAKSSDKTLNQNTDECFDINENCVDLESRRIRNNNNNKNNNNNNKNNNNNNKNNGPVQAFQQFPNMPKEFNSNIASYLNSFMPNQNFNTDMFSANGNFPYNFDYMNQMPQQSNTDSSGSNKRRRNRRRKKRPKNNRKSTNNNETSNNQHIDENYNKVVELLPNKPVEIRIKTKPTPTVPQIEDIVSEKELSKENIEAEIIPEKVNVENVEVILEPTVIIDETQNQNLEPSPVSQEYTLNVYDNDIFDDYYPDFTSDNIYLSKEDQDWNFHDRHYYSPDNKAEMSRERRKYEPSERRIHKTNRVDTLIADELVGKNSLEDEKVKTIEEVKFKTPPGLDFPDFKTEMINKDKYSPKIDIKYQPHTDNKMYQNDKISSFSNVKSIDIKNKSDKNTVETVYARSKVAKYGVPETKDKSDKKSNEFARTDKLTSDENTTIVLAQSVNYPIGYK